jgi:UPF0716 protein FxsA
VNSTGKTRSRRWAGVLAIAFIVVPLLEIYVLIQVGQVIGPWWTILLLVADSILGGWLIRREGARAWRALRDALDQGRMPARQLADGVLIVLGGALMLSPGFVTDVLGILLILPVTRPVFRRMLTSYATSKAVGRITVHGVPRTHERPGPTAGDDSVVRGEVLDES